MSENLDTQNDTPANWIAGKFNRFQSGPWRSTLEEIRMSHPHLPEEAIQGLELLPILYQIKPRPYMDIRERLSLEYGNDHRKLNRNAYKAYLLFGNDEKFGRFVTRVKTDDLCPLSLKQMVSLLHFPPEKDWAQIDFRAWGDAFLQKGLEATGLFEKISMHVDPARNNTGQISLLKTEFQHIAGQRKDTRLTEPVQNLIDIAVGFRKSAGEMKRALNAYKKTVSPEAPCAEEALPDNWVIDGKRFDMNGYVFRKLNPSDPRILFLGDYTNCCERVTDTANNLERTVTETIHDQFHAYYVVERKKNSKIVAHSWAYRGYGGSLIFDGFESHQQNFNAYNLTALIREIAQDVRGDFLKPYDIDGLYLGENAVHFRLENLGPYDTSADEIVDEKWRKAGISCNHFIKILEPSFC